MIYLDHAATTPMKSQALKALCEASEHQFANPNSSHKLGKELQKKLEAIKTDILKDFPGYDIIFTSGATESNNMVIKGLRYESTDEIFYDPSDHPSISKVAESFNAQKKLTNQTKLILLSHVNNLNGKINFNPEEINKIKNEFPKIHIHIDGAQAFGKLRITKCNFDSYSFSAHKMGGPKGIGGLILKKGVSLLPLIEGGGQQNALRSGTIAFPLINSFYEAYKNCEFDKEIAFKEIIMEELKDKLEFPFEEGPTSPYILMAKCEGISSDILLRQLESRDIFISSSSACSSKIKGTNPTFSSMGLAESVHKNILRISFGAQTTTEEVKAFVENFNMVYRDLAHLIRK